MLSKICTKCSEEKPLSEYRDRVYKNGDPYKYSQCKACEKGAFQKYQKENKQYFNDQNRAAYLKRVGEHRWILNRSKEDRLQRARDKANRRCTRAKQARVGWDLELTKLVYTEAHELRKLRNKLTGFEWHVDHVIPLVGKKVCGLHVWNNFAVIPKVDNLRKGNYHSISEERCSPI